VIHIGFTGTRHGMTDLQQDEMKRWLASVIKIAFGPKNVVAHHGDCLGADEDFHEICRRLEIAVHLHPPAEDRWRAFVPVYDAIEPVKPFALRNLAIVQASRYMLATPKSLPSEPRGQGGTWQTIRIAQRLEKPTIIVFANAATEGAW
jgi:hypothetical protein